MTVLAHGLTDAALPVPLGVVQLLAIAAVIAAYLWSPAGRRRTTVPVKPRDETDGSVPLALLRAVVGVVFIAAVVSGLFGPADAAQNPGGRLVWVLLPAVLLVGSLTVGERLRLLNPLRSSAAVAIAEGNESATGHVEPRAAQRIAVGGLALLVWLRLFITDDPFMAAIAAAVYALLTTAAAMAFGREWFRHGDPVELAVTTLAEARRPTGHGAAPAMRNGFRVRATVAVLIGGTALESLLEATSLGRVVEGSNAAVLALALLVAIAAVYLAAVTAAPTDELAPALVPVAAGYLGVHALTPLILDSQIIVLQVADAVMSTFARGGTVVVEPSEFVGPEVLGLLSVIVLTAGHLWGVAMARRLPLRSPSSRHAAARLQFAGVVGASLYLGLTLLF